MLRKLIVTSKLNKKAILNLQKIAMGVGPCYSQKFLSLWGFSGNISFNNFISLIERDPSTEVELCYFILKQRKLNQDYKNLQEQYSTILLNLKVRNALRSALRLPIRGQRTHTNARTTRKIIRNAK
jgi:ribosomal protein S13